MPNLEQLRKWYGDVDEYGYPTNIPKEEMRDWGNPGSKHFNLRYSLFQCGKTYERTALYLVDGHGFLDIDCISRGNV